MFGRKKQARQKVRVEDVGNVPPTAYDRVKAEWAERNGDSTVNQARLFIIAAGLVLALILTGIAFNQMLPLKTAVPYQITFDQDTGKTDARPIKIENFSPTEVQRRYFLGKWVGNLLRIDPYTLERDLKAAYARIRGKAVNEFREYLRKTEIVKRSQQDRTLTREVKISSLSFIAEGVAQARVALTERTANTVANTQRYIVTIHYGIEPPTTEAAMQENPVGLFITHFAISEELQ